MSIKFQARRGTTAQIAAMTPAEGEILYDKSRHSIVVGDGAQAGGYPFPSLNAQGWVGIGASPPTSPLNVFNLFTDPSAAGALVNLTSSYTYTANNANQMNGISFNFANWTVPLGVTISGGYSAIRLDAFINSAAFAGTMNSLTAIWARAGILLSASTGVLTSARGVLSEVHCDVAGASINTLQAFVVSAGTIAGIVSSFYGFYMPALTVTGTITNLWGIAILEPNAKNYFAGTVQIGTTINNGALTVGGNVMPEADNSRNLGNASFRWAVANIVQLIAAAARITTAKTPATSGAPGTQGDFAWDASYLYICTAANTWRRVAHASW